MLAMADHAGRVWGSIPGLANRARVSVEDVEKALESFLAPDKYSRTQAFEGRRIEVIEGGWRLLNHAKYRALRDEEAKKESKRNYINKRRAKERGVENVDRSRHNAEADTEADVDTEALKAIDAENAETIYKLYPRKVGKPGALKAIKAALRKESAEFLALQTKKFAASPYVATKPEFIPHPATWFNQERYNDEADWSMVVIPAGQPVGGQNGQPTKAQQRTTSNIGAIQAGLGIEPRGVRGSLPAGDKRGDSSDLRRTLEGEVPRKD